ncbi:MAG TPA: butyrate kinase [Terracidiphilus sp.]|nr:butyrate kinase [Terracidiphilus sp.]
MNFASGLVLTINPAAASTKFGVFTRAGQQLVRTLRHGDEEQAQFRGQPLLARAGYRAKLIREALEIAGYSARGCGGEPFAAVAGRGGLLRPVACGTYLVDNVMVEELRRAERGEHAANLGALIALEFARDAGVNAYVVDPVTADEWQDCARYSGSPLVQRTSVGHALNTKAVARRYARGRGREYASMRLVVVHLGNGITVSAHRDGLMVDSNTIEEGPFGPDRTGSLPARELIKLCFSGQYTQAELDRHVFGDGGLFAYLGSRDPMQVERRIEAGDREAEGAMDAMLYQVAKEAGAMATVLQGKVDAVLLTGSMACSRRVTNKLCAYLEWIAPVANFPGEDELRALAEGAFRVLDGEEEARRLPPL